MLFRSFNGTSIPYTVQKVKGTRYAVFTALSGTYKIGYVPDTFAPRVISVTPRDGGTGVIPDTKVQIAFDEAMDEASINSSTITLRDSSNVLAPAAVSYDSQTSGVTLSPDNRLASSTTYTVKVSGVTDLAGNRLAVDFTSTFTTAAASNQTFSIWASGVTPAVTSSKDSASVELGLKFTSASSGYIKQIRFYKGVGNTGTHVGNLWTSSGTRLATVTFTNETASGWQSQALSTPVPVSANTTYIVSYFAPVGRYSANLAYFASAGVDNYPLRALANSESGGNGVYLYSGSSAFPNQTYNSNNYWVDIVFGTGL